MGKTWPHRHQKNTPKILIPQIAKAIELRGQFWQNRATTRCAKGAVSPRNLENMTQPKFEPMNFVRGKKAFADCAGYVISVKLKDGRYIYKVSLPDDLPSTDSFDTWIPEELLERARF